MNKLIYILLFAALPNSVFGQFDILIQDINEVHGAVTNQIRGVNLSGVLVKVLRKNSNFTQSDSVSTAIDGSYDIPAQTGDSIIFSLNNFETHREVVKQEIKIDVKLKPIILTKEIDDPFSKTLSSSGKKDRPIGDIPASVVLVTKEEIAALGYQTVEEILINVPGLYGIEQHDWTGQGTNLGTRGFYSSGLNNEMVIMVNGVSMLEDHWSFFPLSRIDVPVESIERIEIIRGPMSVIYGSGAFLGSIDIITNLDSPDKDKGLSGSGTVAFGADTDYRASAVLHAESTNRFQTFSAGISRFVGLDQAFSDIIDDPAAANATTGGLFPDQRSFLNYSGVFKEDFGEFRMNLSYSQANKHHIFGFDPIQGNNRSRLVGGNGQLNYLKFVMNEVLLIDAKLSYFSHKNFQDFGEANGGGYGGFASFESNAVEAELNGIWNLANSTLKKPLPIEITTGLYYRRAFGLHTGTHLPDDPSLANSFYRLPKGDSKQNIGVVLNSFWRPSINADRIDKIEFVGGVRMEVIPSYDIEYKFGYDPTTGVTDKDTTYTTPFSTVLIPRGGFIGRINPRNIIKLMYGQGLKQPSFGQISDGLALNESKLHSFELNYLNYIRDKSSTKRKQTDSLQNNQFVNSASRTGPPTWALETNVSVFYNVLNNLIDRYSIRQDDGSFIFRSENIGQINTLGAEASFRLTLFNKLTFSVGGTFQYSDNNTEYAATIDNITNEVVSTTTLSITPYSPSLLANANLTYLIRDSLQIGEFPLGEISIGTKFRYVGTMYSEITPEAINTVGSIVELGYDPLQTDRYVVGDVQLSLTNIGKNKGLNINFNVKNMFNTQFHYPYGSNTSWATNGMMGRGRWFMFSVKYSF
jgi:outer membrane receptor protein involved in Fe transport